MSNAVVNVVNLEAVTKAYGPRRILDRVSLGVSSGDRVGVVGRNGDGKSTLVRLIAGVETPDSGRVTHTGGVRVGFLAQEDVLDPVRSIRSAVVGQRSDHEWSADSFVRSAVAALVGDLPFDAPVGALSGGERRRVALAGLLVDAPDLVILDEPTNHLDVEVVDWLAGHLVARRGSLIVVTHDRWFLDAVATRTWDVADGQVHEYDGGYAAYVLARAERERVRAAEQSRRSNLLRKELAWLRRGPPARTSKPRFRIDAANELIEDEPPARNSVELVRFATTRLGRTVYEVLDASLQVGERTLLDHLTWAVGPGDRIGLVGVNGAGKTSLLRLLSGELSPASGRVRVGQTVRPAFLTQEVPETDGAVRVLESVESVRREVDLGAGRTMSASALVERLGFRADRAWTRVAELSGGERRRLQLVRLLMDQPNVLLLDEPSNDLDIETLTSLEDLLDGFAGTVILVSHDRYVLERVCDQIYGLLGDGQLRHLPRGVEEYLELRTRGRAPGSSTGSAGSPGGDDSTSSAASAQRRAASKELARIERRLQRLVADEARLHQALVDVAADHEAVLALDTELRSLSNERAELEDDWLRLAEHVDDVP